MLQNALLANPQLGVVIPSAGGFRKMRWPDPRRGKGKRGGLRIVYLHLLEAAVVFFTVYDKDTATDLTLEQKKAVACIAGLTKKREFGIRIEGKRRFSLTK